MCWRILGWASQEMEAGKFIVYRLAPAPPQPQLSSLGRAKESLTPQCDTLTPSFLGILFPFLYSSLTCKALFPVKEILALTQGDTVLRDCLPQDKSLLVQWAHITQVVTFSVFTRLLSDSGRMGRINNSGHGIKRPRFAVQL